MTDPTLPDELVTDLEIASIKADNAGKFSHAELLQNAAGEIMRLRAEVERLKSELFNAQFLLGEEKRDREFAQIELRNYKAELRRVTGPREPPHCPTCDCPGQSPRTVQEGT